MSPSLDLSACADRLEQRENRIYMSSFLHSLRRRIRRKQRRHPNIYDARGLRSVRTIREFDERFTAPHAGFRDAADYYAQSSALPLVARIRVPTLILHAADDPLIPASSFLDPSLAENPDVLLVMPPRGGHVAFIANAAGRRRPLLGGEPRRGFLPLAGRGVAGRRGLNSGG